MFCGQIEMCLDLNHIGYLTGPEVSAVAAKLVEIGHIILIIKTHGAMRHFQYYIKLEK